MRKLPLALSLQCMILFASSVVACGPATQPASPQLEATVHALLTQVSAQSTRLADHETYISYLATRVHVLPPSPIGRPLPTPFVRGSLLIEQGKCCLGALAGQALIIHVDFQATSPAASVTEMRVRTGLTAFDELDLADTVWEPFSTTKEFEYRVPINWTGFYVTVQFRDAQGNLSPVYASDISVEGMPSPPTGVTP